MKGALQFTVGGQYTGLMVLKAFHNMKILFCFSDHVPNFDAFWGYGKFQASVSASNRFYVP
jgi:hypothetical protein